MNRDGTKASDEANIGTMIAWPLSKRQEENGGFGFGMEHRYGRIGKECKEITGREMRPCEHITTKKRLTRKSGSVKSVTMNGKTGGKTI
jgi:hypothetical protein